MRDSTLAANITKSTIDQFERKYGHEDKYEWPIRQMAAKELGTITQDDITQIAENLFLLMKIDSLSFKKGINNKEK